MTALRLLAAVAALALPAIAGARHTWRLEAEDGMGHGGVRLAAEIPGFSGRGYLTGFVQPGDAVDFSVSLPPTASGYYTLGIRYACDHAKRIPVFVNGQMQGSFLYPKTDGFATKDHGRIFLQSGENVIRIGADWGYADIDCIYLSTASSPGAFQLSSEPSNPAASGNARQLFARLASGFGRRTLSGQHEARPQEMAHIEHIARVTGGAAPVLLGLDLICYSPSWGRDDGDGALQKALWWSRERKGVVTLSWHWLSPFGATGSVWDSFNTDKTSFDVRRLDDEASSEYLAAVRDIDHIAQKLASLRDAGVPVLWRPLHEAEGGWFWWGAHGPEPAKRLYRLLFDRFTRLHRLDNLLWVWTSTADPGASDWYPGHDVVDFIAVDLYAPAGVRGDFFTAFDRLREIYGGRKALAMGECGVLPLVNERAPWLWFLSWDDFIVRENMNTTADILRTYTGSPRIVTLGR